MCLASYGGHGYQKNPRHPRNNKEQELNRIMEYLELEVTHKDD